MQLHRNKLRKRGGGFFVFSQDGEKPWMRVAAGSTIGSSRIIPLGLPGKGQFIPGELWVRRIKETRRRFLRRHFLEIE